MSKQQPQIEAHVTDGGPPVYQNIHILGAWDPKKQLWVADRPIEEIRRAQELARRDHERVCANADQRIVLEDHDHWWPLTAGQR